MLKIHQLSLFLENKPGTIKAPCNVLGEAGINIMTLALADTQQFGILRLVVRDWERAKAVLDEAGFVVNAAEMVAVDVPDRPGGLAQALEIIEEASLDIEYMYAFTSRVGERAVLLFRFADPDAAIAALQAAGLGIVSRDELFAALER